MDHPLNVKITANYQEAKDYSLIDRATRDDIPEWAGDKKPWRAFNEDKWSTSFAERHLYYRLAKDLGPGNYADIGVWHGGSSAALAHGLFDGKHKGTIYAVDFFGKMKGVNWVPSLGRDLGGHPYTLLNYIKNKGLEEYATIKICQGNSRNIGEALDVSFNFVSIDADHTYLACKADYEIWSPKVKKGGMIAFNDIVCLSVDRVIKEIDPNKWKFVRQIFNTKVFERI